MFLVILRGEAERKEFVDLSDIGQRSVENALRTDMTWFALFFVCLRFGNLSFD